MRITDLHVDGFGVWNDLELHNLSPEVTVFYGLNEAGKTTLMHFLRSLLYGVSPERRASYLPPQFGGRPGGRAGIENDHGKWLLNRYADRGANDVGRVVVELPDGTQQGDRLLLEAIEHVDEDTFSNVFALGLDEIQHLGTLSGSEAAQSIYRLTSGLDRVSLYDVIQGLRGSQRRIAGDVEADGQLDRLFARRDELQSAIADLSGGVRKWSQLGLEAAELDSQVETLRAEAKESERRARRVELAINLRPHWIKRDELRNELRRYENLYPLEPGALKELDALNDEIEEHQRQHDMLKGQRQQLREESNRLGINDVLCRQGCRVAALGEQQEWLESLQQQADEFETEAKELEAKYKAESERLASQWLGDSKRRLELTPKQIEQLAPQQAALEAAEKHLAAAQSAADVHRGEADKYRLQMESALLAGEKHGLPTDLREAGDLVAKLRRRLQVEQRIEQSKRQAIELEQQSHDALEEQVLPLGWYAFSGLAIVTGVALLAWYFITNQGNVGQAGGLLLTAGVAVQIWKWWAEIRAGERLDACHRQIELLERQLTEAKHEQQKLDAELPLTEGSVVIRLQTAERHLAELEQMLPVETQRKQATEASKIAERELDSAKQRASGAVKAWESQLKALGLPTALSPAEVKILAGKYEELNELANKATGRRDEMARRQREFARVVGRIRKLAEESNLVVDKATPLEQLDHLLEQSRLQKSHIAHRAKLRERYKELKAQQASHAREVASLESQREARFRKVGVDDETAYRKLAADLADAQKLRGEVDTVTRQIAVAMGTGRQETEFADLLAPAVMHTLEATWEKMSGEAEALNTRLAEVVKRRGNIEAQQQALVDDSRLVESRLELDTVEAQIAEAEETWRERATLSFFLEWIRQDYEQHRQPETLREATEYFARLTNNQYVRVWTPMANDILLVDRADGTSLGVEALSRGTREQLFLSIRLALVAMYARRGVQLPMVLDDVLVNYDERRATRAAEVLTEFARQGHQLLVFTCHEHVWSIFKSLKADVRRLPSRYADDVLEEVVEEVVEQAIEPMPIAAVVEEEPIVEEVVEMIDDTPEEVEFDYGGSIPERIEQVEVPEFEYAEAIPQRIVQVAETIPEPVTAFEYDWSHDDYGRERASEVIWREAPVPQQLAGRSVPELIGATGG